MIILERFANIIRQTTKNYAAFLLIIFAISFIVITVLFTYFEKGTNPNVDSYFDSVWWWVISTTTVGYGDIYPITTAGRILAMITVVQGLYLYTNIIALTSNSIIDLLHSHKLGTKKYLFNNHIVLCDYTALTDEFILQLDRYPHLKDKELLVVSDLIESNPYSEHYFVKGSPFSPHVMHKASIDKASHIFIFSNARYSNPDLKTIHLALRLRRMNKNAKLILELKEPDEKLIKSLSGDIQVVDSDDAIKNLLENRLLFEGLK